jgi:hypothetical protein
MQHEIEHPWGTGEQIVGETPQDIYDRMDEKMERWNPAKNPGSFAAPESTLNRQIPNGPTEFQDGVGVTSGRPGGHAGYGR